MYELAQLPARVGGAQALFDIEERGQSPGSDGGGGSSSSASTAIRTPYQFSSSSPQVAAVLVSASRESARAGAPISLL